MNTVRSKDGTEIALDRTGEGPPLILVGGALSDRSAAAELATLLAEHLTVYAFDRRGRGGSGDTLPYAVEREIEDLAALTAEAGGSVSLFGHSSGAALALEAAAHGVGCTKLALYEPPFIIDDTRPPLPEDYVAHLDELIAADERGEAVAYFMTVGVGLPPEMVEGMRGAPMWPALEALAHTLGYDNRVMGDHMASEPLPVGEWSSVSMPTLVMDGDQSPPWQRNAVRTLAELLPNAEYRTLEGQDHGASPEALAPVLVAFLGD